MVMLVGEKINIIGLLPYYPMTEHNFEEEALVPTINLVGNVDSSMWVFIKNGQNVKMDLYIATMDDMVRSLLQQ